MKSISKVLLNWYQNQFFLKHLFAGFSVPFNPTEYDITPGGFSDDKSNLSNDWKNVQKDMRSAIDYYEKNGKTNP